MSTSARPCPICEGPVNLVTQRRRGAGEFPDAHEDARDCVAFARELELAPFMGPEDQQTLKKVWPVRDDAQRALFSMLIRHPEIAVALVDLTKGRRLNTTLGGALAASVVDDLVGMWRARKRA